MLSKRGGLGLPVKLFFGCLLLALALVPLSAAASPAPAAAAQGAAQPAAQAAATAAVPTPAAAGGSQGGSISAGPVMASTPPPLSGPLKAPDALAGRDVYNQDCAACHGQLGDGKGPSAANLPNAPAAFKDFNLISGISLADMMAVIKNGRMDRMMPPWGSVLNEQQIRDVAGYAWTLHTSNQEVTSGKGLFAANCASCHGLDGKGKQGVPDLTDFAATSTKTQANWLQVIGKGQGQMPGYDGKLQPAEQQAVAEYARSLSFSQEFRAGLSSGPGVITGTVVNGTTGQIMANLPITLTVVDGQSVADNRKGTTDAAGKYSFASLPTDSGLAYYVNTNYPAGIPYATDPITFTAQALTKNAPLHVFEPTNDAKGLTEDRLHFIVEFDPSTSMVQVAELAIFSLDGDRTYVGDASHVVLRFTLPQGAQGLQISDDAQDGRYQQTAEGFVDTMPLLPGPSSRQLLFRYEVPYTGSTLNLVRSSPYPVANLNALVVDAGEKVTSPGLQSQNLQQTGMGNFFSLSGQNIPANQPVTLQFTNLPAPGTDISGAASGSATPAPSSTDRLLLIALAGVVGLGVVGLTAWPILRRRTQAAAAGGGAEDMDRETLIDMLAQLDLAHEAGTIPDGEYRERRFRLKAQLLDVVRQEQAS